ncbi:transketolase-like TK C-terminal-containing protein [Pandoraea apista]|uniref:transketolase-like TK C-terminal-containing protein n=1 Tax=Pandoraea apista TaxID=93218 RepID=UPI000F665FF5|nr:pyruvate dehydrogenase [Pandoraea apista]
MVALVDSFNCNYNYCKCNRKTQSQLVQEAHPQRSMMNWERLRPPAATLQTRLAAQACLEKLATEEIARVCSATSPYAAIQAIAQHLTQDDATHDKVCLVRASPGKQTVQAHTADGTDVAPSNISAWPLWFQDGPDRFEIPLLYLLRSESVAGLQTAIFETANRGILCNDAEITSSRWPKSVQPAVPVWLASSVNGIPYDPASGQEALAILRAAMQALYADHAPGFFYLTLHDDEDNVPAPSRDDVRDAYKGMYRLSAAFRSKAPAIRLLGAGKALGKVIRAADLLQEDWDVACEVWSCPSYTRLAREGYEVERWNMLHPLSTKKTSYIQRCLGSEQSPVLAVTGYGQHIAHQIGGVVSARFVALGPDSHHGASGFPSVYWIVFTAIKALCEAGKLPMRRAEQALKRYALT